MQYLNTNWSGNEASQVPVGRSDILNLPGNWTTFAIPLAGDISDAANHHSSPTVLGHGPFWCHGILDYQIIGGELGAEVQIRTYEVDTNGDRVETHRPHEFYLSANPIPVDANGNPLYVKSTHQRFPIMSYINDGHFLKAELTIWDLNGPAAYLRYAQFQANYLP